MATMTWIELANGALWGVALCITLFLGWHVSRRRGLPAYLFLGIAAAVVVLQGCQFVAFLAKLLPWLSPGPTTRLVVQYLRPLWPVEAAALVILGALAFHLCLVFPVRSWPVRASRWSPLLFYAPAVFLAGMALSRLGMSAYGYRTFWRLGRLGMGDDALPLLYAVLLLWASLLRFCVLYLSRLNPLARRQLSWILTGIIVGGGLAALTSYVPVAAGLPRVAGLVPGLDQVPALIVLGALSLAIIRHHTFDLETIVQRSVLYSALMVVVTILYIGIGTALGSFFQFLAPGTPPSIAATATALLVVLVALPLRDAIWRLVERFIARRTVDYHRLFQRYSHELANILAEPRLLSTIVSQIEEALQPVGSAIVLAGDDGGYLVEHSTGRLASQPPWQKGARFEPDDFVAGQLAARSQPFYLPWHSYGVGSPQKAAWDQLEASGACVLVPISLQDSLSGWLVVGPKASDLPYAGRELDFLSALASHSSVVLENARMCGEMQRRASEIAMLGIISSAISSSHDVERILETIVESAIKVVGCRQAVILEFGEEGTPVIMRLSRGVSEAQVEALQCSFTGADGQALVAATRQQIVVPDIKEDERFASLAEAPGGEGFRGLVSTPLAGRESILGALVLHFAQPYRITPADLDILITFANQAAIAIERARLYHAITRERDRVEQLYQQTDAVLAQRVKELTTIEEISRQLAGTLDLGKVMDLVLERGMQATGADRGVIALYDPEKHCFRILAQAGFPLSLDQYRLEPWPDNRGITGRVARTSRLALVPDVSRDSDYVAGTHSTRSQLSVPINYEGQVIGVITLESDQLAAFTNDHARFAGLLADHAAIGINNAQLFKQITEGKDQLEAILNSTHDAVVMLDQSGKPTLVNPQVSEMFGPSAETWLRSCNPLDPTQVLKSGLLSFTDLDPARLAELTRSITERPDLVTDVGFGYRIGDQQRFVEGRASPVFSAAGEVIGRVAVLRDVTRRWEVERFREDVTSMVIHNLQGPLAALITSLQTLWAEEDVSEQARELLRIGMSSAEKLYERIESVLLIRRLEDKRLPMDLRTLPLAGVIEVVVDEYRPVAAAGGIRLETHCTPDWLSVPIDEELIGRVFSNLVDNALKFTPEGGCVEVRATLAGDAHAPYVLCVVSDSGPGIARSLREVIFEKFRRGESAPRNRRHGMGIGLYYCKLAVEAHRGKIWVESDKGKGTRFFFTLPAQ
jgi:NtrC-family two-component system sensor histidine kinase KinB